MTSKDTALVRAPETPVERSLSMIETALERGWSGEQLNSLLEFAKNVKAESAKEAYFKAFKAFKDKAPKIIKKAEMTVTAKNGGSFKLNYASLDMVCNELIPALREVGITHRWTSHTDAAGITVTCYLRHEMGYEEQGASLTAGPDTSGSKNAVQAIGSTTNYLQRYTFLGTCGVAVEGVDTNGVADEGVTQEEGSAWVDKIGLCESPAECMKVWTDAINVAKKFIPIDYKAMTIFTEARDKRLLEIRSERGRQ